MSAGKIQNRCPGCRAQLLSFYDALLQPRSRSTTAHAFLRPCVPPPSSSNAALPAAAAARPWGPGSARQFSTSRPVRQEPPQERNDTTGPPDPATPPTPEDMEAVVRQARQTFGNTLPPDFLTPEEYKVYERLYGPPLRETGPEEVDALFRPEEPEAAAHEQHVLLRQTEDGEFEEVEYEIGPSTAVEGENAEAQELLEGVETADGTEPADLVELLIDQGEVEYLNVAVNSQREYDAVMKLQNDFQAAAAVQRELEAAAALQPAEEINEDEVNEEEEPDEDDEIDEDEGEPDARFHDEIDNSSLRLHDYTKMGKFKTSPSTIQIPKPAFVEPITELLARTDITHIKETAERVLGGPGLPNGPSTPRSKANLPQKGIAMEAGHHKMSQIEADAYIATVLPGLYATATSVLVEVRKRLGDEWLKGLMRSGTGPRVLDVGAGGAGLSAWQDVLRASWEVLRDNGEVKGNEPPVGKKTVVVGSDNLRQRVSRFLHDTTFLPRLPDYVHSIEGAERKLDSGGGPAPRKVFDVIIASHMLMPLEKEYKRKEILDNLWSMLSPEGGVLIVLEKGHPRGFEAVANVRERILEEFIIPPTPQPRSEEIEADAPRVREPGMIIAPCTTHTKCPMYLTPGLSQGRKDFCHFNQRYIRPPFLQKVLGASHRSHEDIQFSYIAVRRGAQPEGPLSQGKPAADAAFAGYEGATEAAAPSAWALPRNILPPLKRRGHVTLDLCTPAGDIERWVVPRSFSRQAYHDARKAAWGDLWALGAKTRTVRRVRLGRGEAGPGDGGVRAQTAAAAAKGRKKPKVIDINLHPQFGVQARERGRVAPERRTKGGKKVKLDELMDKLYGDEKEEFDEDEEAIIMEDKPQRAGKGRRTRPS
ncbi:mitochondrial small ribosomal subunit Rsm22-domain-containing protein [Staphylotrichum tortipilum]|uniref:Mitochondrial small ribosomal subunit Rsm22-domain-containing protein n=1 Tax=Staphylotrichum tortipilum TaxID=2831512 RepID=A0AAN6MNY1_9PEZI|nr:mitochondrial small ribosomal subunit Rsm22-domain-containing protein [Staphylotrichum longicolle]